MANITAQMVKDLRDLTGAGMMDCKAALGESGGNVDAAVDWLRKKGLSKAAKKADRVAAEGLIGVTTKGTKGVVVEVNSETDFVARNDQFQGYVRAAAGLALAQGGDVEKVKAAAPLDRIAVSHGNSSDVEVIAEMLRAIPSNHPLIVTDIGSTVGTHGGPGIVGVSWISQ